MVPAPWAQHAAGSYEPTDDIGVHLTLNAEHAVVPMGPGDPCAVAAVGRGRVPARHRRPVGARRPRRGVPRAHRPDHPRDRVGHRRDPPGAASDGDHAATGVLRHLPRRWPCEFRLPIRLPSTVTAEQAGFPFRRLAADEGCCSPTTSTTIGVPGRATECSSASAPRSRASPNSTSNRRSTRPRSVRSDARTRRLDRRSRRSSPATPTLAGPDRRRRAPC